MTNALEHSEIARRRRHVAEDIGRGGRVRITKRLEAEIKLMEKTLSEGRKEK